MSKHYLITGGAGFIGSNYVDRLLTRGAPVTVYDNLSRKGAELNLAWLRDSHGPDSFDLVVGDLRDASLLATAARDVDVIVHLAGQVAVTTSVNHPRQDFEDNALGNLQPARGCPPVRAESDRLVRLHQQSLRWHGRCRCG